ncbi:unnamed protein product, partial [Symbiodinium sp. CCMP2456]
AIRARRVPGKRLRAKLRRQRYRASAHGGPDEHRNVPRCIGVRTRQHRVYAALLRWPPGLPLFEEERLFQPHSEPVVAQPRPDSK